MQTQDLKRLTVKLGTSVVSTDDGKVNIPNLRRLLSDVAELHRRGREVLIVTSGAIGLGRNALGLERRDSLAFKQACAAVGQSLLMKAYQELMNEHGIRVAQILVTADDLSHRRRYLNLREMLQELLRLGVVPILNENDSVATNEIVGIGKEKVFGDNDKLSALVASKLGSQLLILLSNVDGIYDSNPSANKNSKIIKVIKNLTQFESLSFVGKSQMGRGGMAAKVEAIKLASMSGVFTVVGSGFQEGLITSAALAEDWLKIPNDCTVVYPTSELKGRAHWIGFSSGIEGIIVINVGAQNAIEEKKASLLAVGVIEVSGEFDKGDVVRIQNEAGVEVARGIVELSAEDIKKRIGLNSAEIKEKLGLSTAVELVHRDKMAVFQER